MTDFRYALRQLRRQPGFTLAAVLTLGLGIALFTTQFSQVYGLLLRPLPFAHGERIQHVGRTPADPARSWLPLPLSDFVTLRDRQESFQQFAAWRAETYNLAETGELPRRLWGSAVSGEFFAALGVQPQLGRLLDDGDAAAGQPLRAVINDTIWQEVFAGSPEVIGRSVRLNGEVATVIGVMPAGFAFPSFEAVWVNLRVPASFAADAEAPTVEAMGMLKPGGSPSAAAAELSSILKNAHRDQGDTTPGDDTAMTVQSFQHAYNGDSVELLYTMLAMTGLVLLLACANVANLMVVRGADRMSEIAVRSALGAGQSRLLKQLLIESGVLGIAGAVIGLLLSAAGIALLRSQLALRTQLPDWIRFDLDGGVLAVAALLAVCVGALTGVVPALRAARLRSAGRLRQSGRGTLAGTGRVGRWLSGGQLAFACTAMVVAALLALNVLRSARLNLDYDPASLLIGRLELQGPAYAEATARTGFYQRLLERVSTVPGVAAAAVSSRDLVDGGVYGAIEVDGVAYPREHDRPQVYLEVVSRDYFRVVQRAAVAGRLFDASDRADGAPVALVNHSLAARLWPGRDPLGQRLRSAQTGSVYATVVGVVPDLHVQGIGSSGSGAGWYLLQDQQGWGWLELLVRVQGDPEPVAAAVRSAVAQLDPLQPVHSIATLEGRTARRVGGMQILGATAAVFAVVALILAIVGVYAVMAYTARLRKRELGLRLALGARARSVEGLMLRQHAPQTVLGIALGLACGFVLTRPLAAVLSQVSVDDPRIYASVALALALAAFVACWWPARRAGRTSPLVVLQAE